MAPLTGLILIAIISLSGILNSACGARILSVTFFSRRSQHLTYLPLLEELGKRGHNVTILTPIKPTSTKTMKNVKVILTVDCEAHVKEFLEKNNYINPFDLKNASQNSNWFVSPSWYKDLCKMSYDLPQVKDILREEFDVILFQPIFNECALGLVHRLKAPVILLSPLGINNYRVEKVAGYFPPSSLPYQHLGDEENYLSYFQRFVNFVSDVFLYAISFNYEPTMQNIYRDKLGNDIPSVMDILGNASLVLSYSPFSLPRSQPLSPDVVDVGGIHCRPAEPLPKELEDFVGGAMKRTSVLEEGRKIFRNVFNTKLKGQACSKLDLDCIADDVPQEESDGFAEGANDGLIYFSMGSAINGSSMPEEKRLIFINVFAKLKQRVLWKWETETMDDLPSNVKLVKWVPQQDVLGHQNTRMFLTQCGGLSIEEGIYHGVPLVGLPIFGHQRLNAKRAKDHGFIVELDWNELTEEKLSSAIQEILNNPSYRDNVKRLSSVYRDQPDKPLDRAVYWIEYVVRHKGAVGPLRSSGRKLNFFLYPTYLNLLSNIIHPIMEIVKYYFSILLVIAILRDVLDALGFHNNWFHL